MKKSVAYLSILMGGAFLLTSSSQAYTESFYPEVESFTVINSESNEVSACFALFNTSNVVSDNLSELKSDGFEKLNTNTPRLTSGEDSSGIYCKNLGRVSNLPDLYEKQFTYAGTYETGDGTESFSIYNLPIRIGKSGIPATSPKHLEAQLKNDYENGNIGKEEFDGIKLVLSTILDGAVYRNPNPDSFMPDMNAVIIDYSKVMELKESMGADSWNEIRFFKELDSYILEKTGSEEVVGHYLSLPLSYEAVFDQNGDWLRPDPYLIQLPIAQFPTHMNIKANSAWMLSYGDNPGAPKLGKAISDSHEWFYNLGDAFYNMSEFIQYGEMTDIHTVPTKDDDGYLTLNIDYSWAPFDFILSGDLKPDAPIQVPDTGISTKDGGFVQAKVLAAVLLIAVPVTAILVRRFIRRPKISLSRKK